MQFLKKYKFPLIIFFLFLAARIPFITRYIFYWDGIQYVLGVLDFDISSHQPHPPGFINYIAAARFISYFLNNPELSLKFLSIFCGAISGVFYYFILLRFFKDKTDAFLGVLLFFSSPVLWFYSEVVNSFIPGLCMLLLFIYIALEKKKIYFLSMFGGWLLGIRIYLVFIIFPLLVYVVIKRKAGLIKTAVFIMLFIIGILIWLLPTIYSCGGAKEFLRIYQEHISFNLRRTVFSADYSFSISLCINLIYLFWAVRYFILFMLGGIVFYICRNFKVKYFGIDRWIRREDNLFFLIWLASGFFFYTLFMVINPGYLISIIPVVLIFSFTGLNYILLSIKKIGNFKKIILVLFILFNCYHFLFIDSNVSLARIKEHDKTLLITINTVKERFRPDETVIIAYSFFDYGLRHAAYYLPKYYVFMEEEIKGSINPIPFFKGRRKIECKTKVIRGYVFPDKAKYVVFFSRTLEKFELAKVYSKKLKHVKLYDNKSLWFVEI